jgi:hypothetical protein
MNSHDTSDITGLYGRCPHCNWSIKAKSDETSVTCDSCKKPVNILNGQFVVPGATSPPTFTGSPLNRNNVGCIVVLVILVVLAFICMSGRSTNTPTPDYTPVTSSGGSSSGSGSSTTTDVRNNPCYVACATRLSRNPDLVAPQCRNVTPRSEYEKCIQGAAASIADLCLKECGLK